MCQVKKTTKIINYPNNRNIIKQTTKIVLCKNTDCNIRKQHIKPNPSPNNNIEHSYYT